jgi:rhamnulokinase
MSRPAVVAAVDLGASGGRVIAARVSPSGVQLHEVTRFPNEPVTVAGTLHWDILGLYASVEGGLRTAAAKFPLDGAGIDSWGVDYGLLDASGALVGNPVHYRDARTDAVTVPVPAAELYALTGIQHLPFNTIYQLTAALGTPALACARTLLLIPDLLGYWLTGAAGAEVTNASTTALLDVRTRTWATGLMDRAGIPSGLFPALRQPGDAIGDIRPDGIPGRDGPLPLIAVGSHDTASAVAAVPADGPDFAFISSGTWSLVGMELDAPVVTEASRQANFTNEAGIDGTVRYLRNVTGLWLLQECMRHWARPDHTGVPATIVASAAGQSAAGQPAVSGKPAAADQDLALATVLRAAAAVEPLRFVLDADDPVFLPPGDMPARIAGWLSERGLPAPATPGEFARCVLDSLALAYRRAVLSVQALSGRHADVLHIVGGGARNELLCQLTADATGLPVIAGPAEATAIGNALVQARALGAAPGDLAGLRSLLRNDGKADLRWYQPSAANRSWADAARRAGLE